MRRIAWMVAAAAVLGSGSVPTAAQVKPRLVIAFDTSGSMALDLDGVPTFGDGVMTNCAQRAGGEWCGTNCTAGIDTDCDGMPNDSRITIAKSALRNMIYGFGDVEFALARFSMSQGTNLSCSSGRVTRINNYECTFESAGPFVTSYGNPQCNTGSIVTSSGGGATCPINWANGIPTACRPGSGGRPALRLWSGGSPAVCGNYRGTCDGGNFLVTFPGIGAFATQPNTQALIKWIDDEETNPILAATTAGNWCDHAGAGDCELRPEGATPLAGLLSDVGDNLAPIIASDPFDASCRGYSVILLTDGVQSPGCGGDPTTEAAALAAAGIDVYVIGFAVGTGVAQLNAIATAGGTDAGEPGGDTAYFANDPDELSAGLSEIVQRSLRFEVCNGVDDDCDGLIDEGFTLYCNRPAGITTPSLCESPGETACDGVDDDCDGSIDEGLLNACGTCGPPPVEVCNGVDDDCDGIIDEGGVCDSCIVSAEICDGLDNDCDGLIDEGVERTCGTNVGVCTSGTEVCVAGVWGMCSGTGPTAEICDGLDNDCDGIIDGNTRPCGNAVGECRAGVETCTAAAWGTCVGAVGPTAERCDALDNDCDGRTDEDSIGTGGACGSSLGICAPGTLQCVGGGLACVGGVAPGTETCNGLDDDCDGRIDEGVPTMGPCGSAVGECRQGVSTCVAGSFVCLGGRGPTTELCNGLDDDCDGSVDEGNPGGGAMCGTDIGECLPGSTSCMGGALVCVGGRGPEMELCDLRDNDCDGRVDEGNPEGGGVCGATDVGICDLGREVCEAGALVCRGAVGPREERCDGIDNDCDGLIDEGNPEGGVACGDDTGECTAGETRCVGGALICEGGIGPTDEICDGLDNDCDGVVDDGLGVGAPCGSSIGECVPGFQVCRDGMVVCEGEVGPTPEICDLLDNDCDGVIDEALPLGEACGSEVGVCEPGALQCISGREVCVGEVPANLETCDCEDNDCDDVIDEDVTCPDGSACVQCGCSLPCVPSEFGPTCPSSRTPFVDEGGACWCVTPRCEAGACAEESVDRDGATLCGPGDDAPDCVCRNNECTFPCDGVTCAEGLVCRPSTGRCVEDSCRGLGCPVGELCDVATGACNADPCADVSCGATEVCRAGECERTCIGVRCDAGEICRRGECLDDPCGAASCGAGEVCDPADGACVTDRCGMVRCPPGLVCELATGMCQQDPCELIRCPMDSLCVAGECFDRGGAPDAGVDAGVDAGTGEEEPDDRDRVLATGGGGCSCAVPGATPSRGGALPLALMLAFFGFGAWRRRRGSLASFADVRVAEVPAGESSVGLAGESSDRPAGERSVSSAGRASRAFAALFALIALQLGGGCDVTPFCLDCVDAGPMPEVDGGVDAGRDARVPDVGVDAGEGDARADGCLDVELCNELDDDCDGEIDEGIDTQTSIDHCGGCGMSCRPPRAFGVCEAGVCGIERCDVGWLDLDEDPSNGCEYRCLPTAEDDSLCDLRDNDCDGRIDEDVDLDGDSANCGSCGRNCRFRHVDTPRCETGVCSFDPATDCEPGWYDINGVAADGCEYSCTPADPAVEICNGRDDDCDGTIDEGDPEGGGACGSDVGACVAGIERCVAGAIACMGSTSPSTERCNGVDDDCDGIVDENNPEGGRACGESVGLCELGREVCTAGALTCVGDVGPAAELCDGLDNDCDGRIDEGNPGGGVACGSAVGRCELGALQCRGGTLVCEGGLGPVAETCNGIDDNCNGMVDEGNPGGGGTCGTDVGACSPGTLQCLGGSLDCVGATLGGAETCNGIDDDCDGSIDEGNPGGGASCGSNVGRCSFGMLQCLGGALACQGGTGPVAETCNTIDDDCDGTVDEGFDLMNDLRNCGVCGRTCAFANAVATCTAGGCVLAGCDPGWRDLDGNPANGCEYACDFAGAEICNGRDDDCDGVVDETLTPPANFCNPNGVCAGTAATCSGVGGWRCNYPASYEETEETCDGLDNDCDGLVDEPFAALGTSCSNGVGACRRNGALVCNAVGDGVVCNAPMAGAAAAESCNGIDDDCDGLIDENPGSLAPTVTFPRASGGGNVRVMVYEASRPDASASASGQLSGYACSRPGVLPWVNVTWPEARAACQALGAGWDLCSESDWERACLGPMYDSPMLSCDWSYATSCNTSSPLRCNGAEFDADPAAPGNQDALYSTGSMTFPGCYTDWTGGARIYDLSGNVKEWTSTSRGAGARAIRGGSYNNVEGGRACEFDFTVAAESFAFVNTGFRCCQY